MVRPLICQILFQSEAVANGADVSHLFQFWTTFVNLSTTKLADADAFVAHRKTTLVQLNQVLQLKVATLDKSFYRNFLIPCLNFEAAILETDKVGFCLSSGV